MMQLICVIGLFLLPGIVFSQASVGNWTFNNTLTATGGTNNTASAAALSAAIPSGAYNGGGVYFGEGGWPTATTIDTNMYLEFTLTPNIGYTLNLSSIDLNIRRSTTGSPSGSGPRTWALRSSLDGFASNITAQTLTTSAPTVTVNLGGIYNNLMSPITFRLYGYDVFINSGGLNRFVFENITVRGLTLLPVSISQLSGAIQNNIAKIQCDVTETGNLNKVETERSVDGTHFESVVTSNSIQNQTYFFSDNHLPAGAAKLYYRIKLMQLDGSIVYSNVIVLQKQAEKGLKINSIVSSGSQLISQITTDANGSAKILVTTIDGKIMHQQQVALSKGMQVYTINNSRQTGGAAILSVIQNGSIISRQFVNQ